jgi:hypothetical protein
MRAASLLLPSKRARNIPPTFGPAPVGKNTKKSVSVDSLSLPLDQLGIFG